MKGYKHLSYEERVKIHSFMSIGLSIRKVSKELGRAPSTISRELKRNEQFKNKRVIYPRFAQVKANGKQMESKYKGPPNLSSI